jgi:hypothetical protein
MLVAADDFLMQTPRLNVRVDMQGIVAVTIHGKAMAGSYHSPELNVGNI